jgi:hypothetical protein
MIKVTNIIRQVTTYLSRSLFRRGSLLGALGLVCLTLFPLKAFGVTPAPDGGYPHGNTAEGDGALFNLDTSASGPYENTAIGFEALASNVSGAANTAIGALTLFSNNPDPNDQTTGTANTAVGAEAMEFNTIGRNNTACGERALFDNRQASYNTATGFEALISSNADDNTATGALSLHSNSSGYLNTASGVSALFNNTTGYYNTANGVSSLSFNKAGHDNTAEGFQALLHGTGSNNVGLGSNAGASLTSGSNNIDIGANVPGVAGEANTIRIGKSGTQQKTFVAGIYGKTVASGVGVIINSNGQLGTIQSSARFKDNVKPMNKASEALLKLKPVTFRYKEELDPDKIPQFGLIAEDVEKVDPRLVVQDEDGKVTTVRYEAVNAMLLNEFLKEHRQVETQQTKLEKQQKQINDLSDKLEEVRKQLDLK